MARFFLDVDSRLRSRDAEFSPHTQGDASQEVRTSGRTHKMRNSDHSYKIQTSDQTKMAPTHKRFGRQVTVTRYRFQTTQTWHQFTRVAEFRPLPQVMDFRPHKHGADSQDVRKSGHAVKMQIHNDFRLWTAHARCESQ